MTRDTRRDEGQYYPYGKRVLPPSQGGGGDVKHSDFDGVEPLPERFNDEDVRTRFNQLVSAAKGASAAVVVMLLGATAFGAGVTVQTAPKCRIYNDEQIVTNVTFDATGLATTEVVERVARDAALELAAATNEVMGEVRGEISDLGSQISGLRGEVSGLRTDFVAASNAFEFAMIDEKDAVDAELVALSQFAVEYADGKVNADVTIPESAARRGVSTVDMYGEDQNAAIELGRTARAAVSGAAIAAAPSNTIVRSVSIAIGEHADATIDGSTRSQALAIGWHAQAKASNAIAIGMGAQHPNEDAMTGNATVASGNEAIAAGYNAKATASRAVQIGSGTNSTPNSLQFMDVPIVRDGKIAVDIPEPEIDEGDVGNIATNVYIDLLSPGPFKCQLAGDGSEPEDQNVFLAPGVFTTLQVENVGSTATNLCGALGINPMEGTRRNYSYLIEEIPEGVAYDSVAISFDHIVNNPSNRVYATPALYRDELEVNYGGAVITNSLFRNGWRLYAADVPCVIDVREPAEGVVLIRRTPVDADFLAALSSATNEVERAWSAAVSAATNAVMSSVAAKVDKPQNVTWAELKAMRDASRLVPGRQYRITDYVATTCGNPQCSYYITDKGLLVHSANHPFDIVVAAKAENRLSESAKAELHAGDTYFSGCNMDAWQLRYCLDNDLSRFHWAQTNAVGRGVVYRMIDEHGNDCPYDFKGLLFRRWAITGVTGEWDHNNRMAFVNECLARWGSWNSGKCFMPRPIAMSVVGVNISVASNAYVDCYTFCGYTSSTGLYRDASLDGSIERNVLVATTSSLSGPCGVVMFTSSHNTLRNFSYATFISSSFNEFQTSGIDPKIVFNSSYNRSAGLGRLVFYSNHNLSPAGLASVMIESDSNLFMNTPSDVLLLAANNNLFRGRLENIRLSGDGNEFGYSARNMRIRGSRCSLGGWCNNVYVAGNNVKVGDYCDNIVFGPDTDNLKQVKDITVESSVKFLRFNVPDGYGNVLVRTGVGGTSQNPLAITSSVSNQTYKTFYQPANTKVISL